MMMLAPLSYLLSPLSSSSSLMWCIVPCRLSPAPYPCSEQGLLYTMDVTTEISNTDMTTAPTGMWLLSTSVEVTNGVTMAIKGTAIDGDCDEVSRFALSLAGSLFSCLLLWIGSRIACPLLKILDGIG